MKLYRATNGTETRWELLRRPATQWAIEHGPESRVEEVEILNPREVVLAALNREQTQVNLKSTCVYSRHQPKKESIEL